MRTADAAGGRKTVGIRAVRFALVLLLACSGGLEAALVRPTAELNTGATTRLSALMKPAWLDNLETALTLATVEYRPVLAFFSSPDCSWCMRLKTQVLQDPELAELLSHFILAELDTAVHRDTAAQYGVRGIPALLVLMSDGRIQRGHAGYVDADGLRKLLEPVLNPELVRASRIPNQEVLEILAGSELLPEHWPTVLTAFGRDPLRDEIRTRLLKLDPFPAQAVVDMLQHPRLAVRTGALDLLEELAGNTFGFDPWKVTAFADTQPGALQRWTQWAGGVTGRVDTVYASFDTGSIERLVQDLVSEDRERSRRAMRLLGQGGEAVARALTEVLDQSPELPEDARRRIRAVQYTLYLPSSGSIPAAETAHRLVFGNPDERIKALTSLGSLGTLALPILREFLDDPDPMIRETAADTLLTAGKRRALADLGRLLLTESDRHVQHAVLRGLGSIKSRASLLLLMPFLSHADENLAVAAFNSIARMESSEPVEAVAAGLDDPRWRVRVAALETAGMVRMRQLTGPILELLKHEPDDYVRFAAVNTLAALSAKDSADTLTELFMTDDALKGPIIAAFGAMQLPLPAVFLDSLPNLTDEALFSVAQGLKEARRAGLPMAAVLAGHANEDIACSALTIIGTHVGEYGQYMPLLVKALESGSRAQRLAVLETLNARSRYQSGDGIDVGFDTLEDGYDTPPGAAAAARPQAEPTAPPSALDDLFAAFADPAAGVTEAGPTPATEPEDTPVDDLFTAFAEAAVPPPPAGATGQPAAGTEPVDDVFAAFEAAAFATSPESTTSAAAGGGAIMSALRHVFSPGSSSRDRTQTVTARFASWTAFTTAAAGCLQAKEADVRLAAAFWLASQGDARCIPELTASPLERTSAQRADIARALGRIRHRDGYATLLQFLDDPAPSVREAAISVLHNSPAGIARMFAAAQQQDGRLTIADVIAHRPRNVGQRPELQGSLRTQATNLLTGAASPMLQNAGLILLGEFGRRADVPLLLPFLEAPRPYQRRAAWYALGQLDATRFQSEINRAVTDPSEWVRATIPALYARTFTSWVHFLDQDTPLRAARDQFYFDSGYMQGTRTSMPEPVRDALRTLSTDPVVSVRFESLFCLMVNRQYVDLQALVDAANAFPDRKAVAGRITQFMMRHYAELGQPFAVLLPYLEASDYADSSLERLRSRFETETEAEHATLHALRRPDRRAAIPHEPLFLDAVTEPPPVMALHAVYFTAAGCRECERAQGLLNQLAAAIPELTVETHDIHQPDAMRLNQILSSRFRVPSALQGVTPALFSGAGYIIRDGFNSEAIGELIAASATIPTEEWRAVTETDTAAAVTAIESRFAEVSIPLLLAYAISDSVNPCAFAAIIFFISYLQVTKRKPRQIAQVALAFIAAVFLTYLALGFGLGAAIARLGALRRAGAALNWLMAGLTLVLALLSVRDAWRCAHGRMHAMTLQLPGLLKTRMHHVIRTQARQSRFVIAAALTGVAISILELACTGQAYLPAIHYMLRTGDRVWDAAGYLVLYNVAFVAPLFIIFGLTIGGMRSETLVRWLQRHAAVVKLIAAALFFMLFAILVHGRILPDLRAWRGQEAPPPVVRLDLHREML